VNAGENVAAKYTKSEAPAPKDFTVDEIDRGIAKLKRRIEAVESLDRSRYNDQEVYDATSGISDSVLEIFGPDSPEYNRHQYYSIKHGSDYGGMPEEESQRNFEAGIPRTVTMLWGLIAKLEEKRTDIGPSPTTTETPPTPIELIQRLFDRFTLVARQLQRRHDSRPTIEMADEYDVQNLLHALLTIYFDDIRPEEWTPSYGGSSARMDFLLKSEGIVIELKKTRPGLKSKEVGSQLIIDIAHYDSHPDCQHLLCFVFDPDGLVANPRGLEADLSKDKGTLDVQVYIRPKL
jgi:hypothetical protein